MKKFGKFKWLAIASLSAVVLVASLAVAQSVKTERAEGQGPRRGWHGEGMKRGFHGEGMFARLNLTDDQKAKIKQVRNSFAPNGRSCTRRVKAVRSMKRWLLRN